MSIPIRSIANLPVFLFALTAVLTAATACSAQTAPTSPSGLIKWSMGKYAEMRTFQADCTTKITANGADAGQAGKRTIQFSKPNQFKIVGSRSGVNQTTVSDGKTLIEFMSGTGFPAQSSPAPQSIADGGGSFMSNPTLSGSLLYRFFSGPDKYSQIVDESKLPPVFGPDATVGGTPCKIVKFYASGTFGTTEAAIGADDGLIHRLTYQFEPLVAQAIKMMSQPDFIAQMKKINPKLDEKALATLMPKSMSGEETYSGIKVGDTIEQSVFAAKAPEGQDVHEQGAPQSPVPLGKPAPEIAVKSVDGVTVKLSSLRGKVVLIDFWATWCPPCRKGLPETQALYNSYGKKGLAVLTISDEPKATVTPYLKSNKLTFPAYLDQAGATNKAWKIEAIPTVAIIDKSGNLSAFFVGLQDKAVIMAALKKAGMATQ